MARQRAVVWTLVSRIKRHPHWLNKVTGPREPIAAAVQIVGKVAGAVTAPAVVNALAAKVAVAAG